MPVKVKLGSSGTGSFSGALLRVVIVVILAVAILGGAVLGYFWFKYQKVVDARLSRPVFANTAQIYAAPYEVRDGEKFTAQAIAAQLRQAGYNQQPELGTYQLHDNGGVATIHIQPGPRSYHSPDGATITTKNGMVTQIVGDGGTQLASYELEPLLITGLSESKERIKRRLVTYNEIPKQLVQAVTAIEDHRFFEHGAVDYFSLIGWVWHDIVGDRRYRGGASTLTMQLAKDLFLSPDKTIKRKVIQVLIAFQLESRFSKQQIFQMYANEINLGHFGSFDINGFGEASQAYFGKDISQLTLPECALLAGTIQSPNYLNPYRHPQRATARRNVVLDAMAENGDITQEQADRAKAEPLHLVQQSIDASEAPYFVDLVHDQLMQKFSEQDVNQDGMRIYTSLDPQLQRIAAGAVQWGMKNVDAMVLKRHTHRTRHGVEVDQHILYPQVAMVALNPHTGQVLALVGGRNYGMSQLDHAIASRPTGSIFKPFVYAAAYNTSITGTQLNGIQGTFTAVSRLNDEPTTFTFDNGRQTYSPHNYKQEYHGEVTAIYALAHSLNNATISLGQMVGFDNVAELARQSGITSARATPSVAIGTYSATPLDMAGAYTVFANHGVHITPWLLASVRNANGDVLADYAPSARQILDPRVAYLTTSLMEGVMNFGYGYEARRLGFMAPAAGKTGTSHDAWFAGYTNNLLCIVWVGNDDYTDVKLAGALAAAPIWAEFMKQAIQLPQYSDVQEFVPPDGVVDVTLDKATNLLADPTCPDDYTAGFLQGTQPMDTCSHPNPEADQRSLFQKIFGLGQTPAVNEGAPDQAVAPAPQNAEPATAGPQTPQQPEQKKKGFWSRIFGTGGSQDKQDQQPNEQPNNSNQQPQ